MPHSELVIDHKKQNIGRSNHGKEAAVIVAMRGHVSETLDMINEDSPDKRFLSLCETVYLCDHHGTLFADSCWSDIKLQALHVRFTSSYV